LEATIATAAVVGLAARLNAVTAMLRTGFDTAVTGGVLVGVGSWLAVRRRAATRLTGIRPDLAGPVERHLLRASRLGATHTGVTLPTRYRPADDGRVQDQIVRIDARVAAKLARAGEVLLAGPVDTDARLGHALARVDAVEVEARAAVGDVVARAVAAGALAGAEAVGLELAWSPEIIACLNCKSMAGGTPHEDGLYRPVKVLTPRIMPWLMAGVPAPPGHNWCRCTLSRAAHDEAAGIRRESDLGTAYGWSGYDSTADMLAGVDLLLRSTRLRPAVRRDAVHNLGMGRFVVRRPPVRARTAA